MTDIILDTADIIRDLVKKNDPDRYKLILLCSFQEQARLLALTALNYELAQCLTATNEPLLAQIKLQWWYEALEEAAKGAIRKHPLIEEIAKADIEISTLLELVTARQEENESESPPTLASTFAYAEKTAGQLHVFMTRSKNAEAIEKASLIGSAWGLISLVRGILYHASASEGLIPTEILAQQKSQGEKHFQGDFAIITSTAAESLLSEATARLSKAKSLKCKMSKNEKKLMKLGLIASHYKAIIQDAGYNPNKINMEKGQLALMLKLAFKSF
ncbi:squalene/phytoene synthase family protein [Temperatibacter marinus]|uniref:Squalene/phytoene synthase family protein n=1 Tax=Temperatibacter marinus TaxID=1456591 RepID=A0AA52ECJ2_9PROT|nr:squalene/phytoene synthase family protein [Temperatibacter marinus]WND02205.1 squalene/phytoene synthase family protein [Temperatibacter marinus]